MAIAMSRTTLRRLVGVALLLAGFATHLLAGFFTQELIAEAAIFAIFALSLDLLATCGLVSFGHAGLLGVGAYVFAGATVKLGLAPGLAMLVAVGGGALAACLVGLLILRTSGAYFIMVTLAAAEMLYAWAFLSRTFNGGDGMGGIPRLDLSGIGIDLATPGTFAVLALVVCAAVWLVLEMVLTSPYGRTLDAVRQNPSRVAALGGRVFAYRLSALTLSGAIAALAGALKVQHTNFVSPDLVSWFVSGDVLIAVVVGGIGTLVGGMLGAALLVLLKDVLSSSVGYWYLFLGVIFIVVALAMPNGIVGSLLAWFERRRAKRADGEAAAIEPPEKVPT